MVPAVYMGLKGNIRDVIAKLGSMTEKEYIELKASALSAAAKREKGAS